MFIFPPIYGIFFKSSQYILVRPIGSDLRLPSRNNWDGSQIPESSGWNIFCIYCWTLTKSKSLNRSASKGLQWSSLEWKWESSGRSCLCFPSPSWSTRPSSSTSSSSTTTMAGSLLRTISLKLRWSYEFLIGHRRPDIAIQITNHPCFFLNKIYIWCWYKVFTIILHLLYMIFRKICI